MNRRRAVTIATPADLDFDLHINDTLHSMNLDDYGYGYGYSYGYSYDAPRSAQLHHQHHPHTHTHPHGHSHTHTLSSEYHPQSLRQLRETRHLRRTAHPARHSEHPAHTQPVSPRYPKTGGEAWVVQHDIDSPHVVRAPTPTPAPLPDGELRIAFRASETGTDVPPAFYPGQTIPMILTLALPPGAPLPLALNPAMTLSLLGTLTYGGECRVLVDISVSLAEGLALWAQDARHIHSHNVSAGAALPAGTYTLPLSAQVPRWLRLVPTFALPNAGFSLTYSLAVSLTCDALAADGRKRRARIAHSTAAFELLPSTLPGPPPRILPHSFWVPAPTGPRATERWVVHAALPTDTYSPTSVIPLELAIHPPQAIACAEKRGRASGMAADMDVDESMGSDTDEDMDLDVDFDMDGRSSRASCISSSCSASASSSSSSSCSAASSSACSSASSSSSLRLSPVPTDPDTAIVARITLVRQERLGSSRPTASHAISSRVGWIPLRRGDRHAHRARVSIPLMLGAAWEHGYTTVLPVDADADENESGADGSGTTAAAGTGTRTRSHVSSTFQLVIDVLFLSLDSRVQQYQQHYAGSRGRVPRSFTHIAALLASAAPPSHGDASEAGSGFGPACPGAQARLWATVERYAAAVPRTLCVPLTVGSVSEPPGAMHAHTWSDITLDAAGDPAGVVSGNEVSDANGWMCAPPAYECAIQSAPYVY